MENRYERSRTVGNVDILIVSESFLPQVNGVTNSVRRALEHLQAEGHRAMLVAPSGPDSYAGAPVHRVRTMAMPTYREFPVGLATRGHLRRLMTAFAPDVVHLASPAWLGHQAGEAARSLGIPVVAVYQTDLIGFAERYPFPGAAGAMRTPHPEGARAGGPHPRPEHGERERSSPHWASNASTGGDAAWTHSCSPRTAGTSGSARSWAGVSSWGTSDASPPRRSSSC